MSDVYHVGEYLFGVLESLGHLGIGHVQGGVDWVLESLSILVDVGDHFGLRGKDDFGFVAEDNLDDFVGKSQELRVAGFHDFFQVNHWLFSEVPGDLLGGVVGVGQGLFVVLEVRPEMDQ